jgi:hypothetical protein
MEHQLMLGLVGVVYPLCCHQAACRIGAHGIACAYHHVAIIWGALAMR